MNDVCRAGFFSVIADEATDTENHEQLAISIRFVKNGQPCERFTGFHRCVTGVSGQALADDILEKLAEWQLQPHLLDQFLCKLSGSPFTCFYMVVACIVRTISKTIKRVNDKLYNCMYALPRKKTGLLANIRVHWCYG